MSLLLLLFITVKAFFFAYKEILTVQYISSLVYSVKNVSENV